MRLGPDPSSYSRPDLVKVQHIDLDWTVNFSDSVLAGTATIQFLILAKFIDEIVSALTLINSFYRENSSQVLDVSELNIEAVTVKANDCEIPLKFRVSDTVPDIGSKLTIDLPTKTDGEVVLVVHYKTAPTASALQWLSAEQTSGKKHPFMFSQCQAIHARSIVPCQDSPAVKFTYKATVHHAPELTALMSAIRLGNESGVTSFEQKVPIPSYLLAIAVGDLYSKRVGPRSHVWAEKDVVDEAAEEFSDTETFVTTAEAICGPYLWKVYDLLVMPPSFPFGGMENPCLTFVTPTLLAGDKSLVDVVAHEVSSKFSLIQLFAHKSFSDLALVDRQLGDQR